MDTTNLKRLTLHRETVRVLDDSNLRQVQGAWLWSLFSCHPGTETPATAVSANVSGIASAGASITATLETSPASSAASAVGSYLTGRATSMGITYTITTVYT